MKSASVCRFLNGLVRRDMARSLASVRRTRVKSSMRSSVMTMKRTKPSESSPLSPKSGHPAVFSSPAAVAIVCFA